MPPIRLCQPIAIEDNGGGECSKLLDLRWIAPVLGMLPGG